MSAAVWVNQLSTFFSSSLFSPDFSEQQQLLRSVQHDQQVAYQVLHWPLCYVLLKQQKSVVRCRVHNDFNSERMWNMLWIIVWFILLLAVHRSTLSRLKASVRQSVCSGEGNLLTLRHDFITAATSSSVSSLRAMSSTTPSISEFGITLTCRPSVNITEEKQCLSAEPWIPLCTLTDFYLLYIH